MSGIGVHEPSSATLRINDELTLYGTSSGAATRATFQSPGTMDLLDQIDDIRVTGEVVTLLLTGSTSVPAPFFNCYIDRVELKGDFLLIELRETTTP
jgi:hypothetical protein